MLLANGYRLVDDMASKGPGGDVTAVQFISENSSCIFRATSAEYNSTFLYGNADRSLSPEQQALPGASPHPAVGTLSVCDPASCSRAYDGHRCDSSWHGIIHYSKDGVHIVPGRP